MTLSKNDIEKRGEHEGLISPYCRSQTQACSYDMTFSGEYYYYDESDGNQVQIRRLGNSEKLYIPADAICYVLTEESVNMPDDLTASISLAFGLIKKGVMLAAQPPYDPGYRGKTVALLHNLSNDEVEISKGEHILNIVFNRLNEPIHADQRYSGKYQDLNSLENYCTQVRKGAVFVLKQELEQQKKKFDNFLPNILTIITIVVAVLTILCTILTASGLLGGKSSGGEAEDKQKIEYYVDEAHNILTITIDGKLYRLDLKTEAEENEYNEKEDRSSGEK